jgi:hypothetical protein
LNNLFLEYKDYYQLNELKEIFHDQGTLIIFDTNIFLDLYSYPLDTRNSIISSFDQVNGILWSPHHVFLEYHKNRREIIHKSKKVLEEIQSTLGSFTSGNALNTSSIDTYKSKYGKFHSELTDSIQKIIDKYSPLYEKLQKDLIEDIEPIKLKLQMYKKQDTVSLTGDDPVLNFVLSKYSDEKIGLPYDSEKLSELFLECDQRSLKKIPPAFKDSSKTEKFSYRGVEYDSKYGDFIIYKQILDYSLENNITNVIFISNDVKRDWREPVPHENNKYYGARRELRAEAYLTSKIENFILLDLKEYLNVLGIELSQNVFEDIDALKKYNSEKKKKIIDQRRKNVKDQLEELFNQPIHVLYDFINTPDLSPIYRKILQNDYPEVWFKLISYMNEIDTNSKKSKKIFGNPAIRSAQEVFGNPTIRNAQEVFDNPAIRSAQEAFDNPAIRNAQEAFDNPAIRSAQEVFDNPAIRSAQEAFDNPAIRNAQEIFANPAIRSAQEAFDNHQWTNDEKEAFIDRLRKILKQRDND